MWRTQHNLVDILNNLRWATLLVLTLQSSEFIYWTFIAELLPGVDVGVECVSDGIMGSNFQVKFLCTSSSWDEILTGNSTMAAGLVSGGPVSLVYGAIGGWKRCDHSRIIWQALQLLFLGLSAQHFLSLNWLLRSYSIPAIELSLNVNFRYPTAGGQYHFVAELSPKRFRVLSSWFSGYIRWVSPFHTSWIHDWGLPVYSDGKQSQPAPHFLQVQWFKAYSFWTTRPIPILSRDGTVHFCTGQSWRLQLWPTYMAVDYCQWSKTWPWLFMSFCFLSFLSSWQLFHRWRIRQNSSSQTLRTNPDGPAMVSLGALVYWAPATSWSAMMVRHILAKRCRILP